MTGSFTEGDLEFLFSGALYVERLDASDGARPPGKAVDFVVEEPDRTLLIEVKDPADPAIPLTHRAAVKTRETGKRLGDQLICDELVSKARDSYTYLHLMERDSKPFVFVFVDNYRPLELDEAVMLDFRERLLKRLRHEARDPWRRQYTANCLVVSPQTWHRVFPSYPLRRLSDGQVPPDDSAAT